MTTPRASLLALRAAASDVFIDEDQLFCSPPLRHVDWIGDFEDAIEEYSGQPDLFHQALNLRPLSSGSV